jgi:hypothetical protein
MADLVALEAEAWKSLLLGLEAPVAGPVIVRGPGAAQVGAAWRLLGYGADGLTADEAVLHGDESAGDGTVAMAALLHAWPRPRDIDAVAQRAARWVRPGGLLLLADLDVAALRSESPRRTPAALLYQKHPEVAARLAGRSPTRIQLVMAGIRAGLDDKHAGDVQRPVGVYDDPSERRAAVEFGVWRGLEDLGAEAYARLLEAVDAVEPDEWPLVEREPWMVVTGRVRP